MKAADLPRAPQRRGTRPETQLQEAVAELLSFALPPDVAWTFVPGGEGKLTAEQGARIKRMGYHAGWPDLLFIWQGRALVIELKTEENETFGVKAGRVDPDQIAMHAWIRTAGGAVAVCRTVDEVAVALTTFGIPLRAKVR